MNSKIMLHAEADDTVSYNRPRVHIEHGDLEIGALVLFPPRERAAAIAFYRAVLTASAEAVCILEAQDHPGAEDGCVRD